MNRVASVSGMEIMYGPNCMDSHLIRQLNYCHGWMSTLPAQTQHRVPRTAPSCKEDNQLFGKELTTLGIFHIDQNWHIFQDGFSFHTFRSSASTTIWWLRNLVYRREGKAVATWPWDLLVILNITLARSCQSHHAPAWKRYLLRMEETLEFSIYTIYKLESSMKCWQNWYDLAFLLSPNLRRKSFRIVPLSLMYAASFTLYTFMKLIMNWCWN